MEQLELAGISIPSKPVLPPHVASLRSKDRLRVLQTYISAFQYNYIVGYQYNILKRRPFGQIMITARDIMRDGLPIKCIEACFLGIYLTCGYPDWQRFPVGFKSKVDGQRHAYRCARLAHKPQHIVRCALLAQSPPLPHRREGERTLFCIVRCCLCYVCPARISQ